MKKSITTRFTVTKTGKGLNRKIAQCHFRSKKTSAQQRRKTGNFASNKTIVKRIKSKPGTL
jgi:ribosomal protein L35